MNYSQFIIKVKEGLQERLGAEVKVEAIHVRSEERRVGKECL